MSSNTESRKSSRQLTQSIDDAFKEVERAWNNIPTFSKLISKREEEEMMFHLISLNPNNEHVVNSKYSRATEELSRIIVSITNYLNQQPNSFDAWKKLGHCYLLLHDYPNAYTAYTYALGLAKQCQDYYFWVGIGTVYQHFKFNKALILFDNARNLLKCNDPLFIDVTYRLAILLRANNERTKAIELFKSVVKSPPKDLTKDDVLFQLAFTYQMDKNYVSAQDLYERLFNCHPNSLELIQQYSWFLSLQNDKESLDKAELLTKRFENDPTLKLTAARIALRNNDMDTAYQRYINCISTWSDSPLFWCGLGVLYFKNKQINDAKVAFKRALFLKQDISEAWLNLGLIFEIQNDTKTALSIYNASRVSCPNSDLIKERYEMLASGRSKQAPQNMILEINDYYTQIADKVANEYASIPPVNITAAFDDHARNVLENIFKTQKSIF